MEKASTSVDTKSRLAALRQLMISHPEGKIDAYLVPSADAHQSEYVADCDLRRQFISGFSGSAGLALVTLSEAFLWTDGRYFLQASQQLSRDWQLMRAGEDLSEEEWLVKNMPTRARVAVDATCISIDAARKYKEALHANQIELALLESNLVDQVWEGRPPLTGGTILVHPERFSGRDIVEKLRQLRGKLEEAKAGAMVVTALDEVAWLYNIRGNDVAYNPVVRSYAIVTMEKACLYVDKVKVTTEMAEYFSSKSIEVREYGQLMADAESLASATTSGLNLPSLSSVSSHNGTPARARAVWLDPATCSIAIYRRVSGELSDESILLQASPLALAKALKNPVELEGMRSAHMRDGAAAVSFWAWLDEQVQEQLGASGYFAEDKRSLKRKLREGEVKLTEISVADKLEQLRAVQEHYVGLSFPTISSVGPNAAVIHYNPDEASCADLDPTQIYLCDSGAQYRDGTTDITRTVHFGKPSAYEKLCFTQVLKGHIMLDTAVFPNGTTGHMLDVLARLPLWRHGLDYRHGTGHGVGSHLNVHEGPHLISFRPQARNVALQASMTVTNEPGYYEDGKFGIRIENVTVVKEVECAHNFGQKGYLGLECITWVPIQVKLVDVALLSEAEKAWLDDYHARCREKLSPLLAGSDLKWLQKATEPLAR